MKHINFKIYSKKRRQRVSVSGISPRYDWWILVGISTILFLLGIGYSIFLYIQVNNGSMFEAKNDSEAQFEIERKRKQIDQKVKIIENRNFDEKTIN